MEKSFNRIKFLDDFEWFLNNLNDLTFVNDLWNHVYFVNHKKAFMALHNNQTALKTFILTELTRERFTCKLIIEKLRNCGQTVVAERLARYNTSNDPISLSNEVALQIWLPLSVRETQSNAYLSSRYPRGKCVIVNFVENPQTSGYSSNLTTHSNVEFKGLQKETERFKYVFSHLFFDVITGDKLGITQFNELSANNLMLTLAKMRNESISSEDQAFVLIIISHGQNDCIYGYDACKAIRENNISGNITEEQYNRALNDKIPIKDLISLFSDQNCPQMSSKPKLFFNICCRIDPPNPQVLNSIPDGSGDNSQVVKIGKILSEQICVDNTIISDTFVCFSCARGFETYFDNVHGFTYFGQAFTHAIAQYACDQSLNEIMNRTTSRLKEMYANKPELVGLTAIEVDTASMNRSYFFNPGYCNSDN